MLNKIVIFLLLFASLAALSACGSSAPIVQEDSCPITQPQSPTFSPPAPWPAESPYENTFWYGSDSLWTMLQSDGTWHSLPKHQEGYVQKVVWWHADYDWQADPMPDITVRGHRLDGEAPDFEFSDGTNMYHPDIESAMLVGISVPSLGCWEITGVYGGEELSFVVLLTDE